MFRNRIALPFYDAFDSGSGGGEGGAPAGGESTAPAEPSVVEITDQNALIKYPGADKPVKFSEYGRQFQAQATRAQQERARIERELAQTREKLTQYERERQQAAQRQQTQNQPGQGQDVFDQLDSLPYLSGKDARAMAQAIRGQIQQRDQVLVAAVQELTKLRKVVGELHQGSTNSAFEAKISKWLTDGGYPPEAAEIAKDIYVAYEGDDLDNEFPELFRQKWELVERLIEAKRQAKVAAARKPAFVPGRGGAAGPSRPAQLDPSLTARQIADKLFPMFQDSGSET